MKRFCLAVAGVACLLPGVLVSGGFAQEGAVQAPDWSRIPNLRGLALARLGFVSFPRPLARPLATDNWNAGSGNWSLAGNWTAGVPTSSSAVVIGNTTSVTVTEDLASAAAASLSINSTNTLQLAAGNTLTVTGTTTVSSGADLLVQNTGAGGSTLNTGSVTNAGLLQVGNYYMTLPSTVNVTGTYTGTGGTLVVNSGNTAGANALFKISGAAPGTLTGNYEAEANTGTSAIVQWGSGGITQIGDGASNSGYVQVDGVAAYLEVGATNSNSALKGLTTIASNGELQLEYGGLVTTTGALTVNAGGTLYVDEQSSGGSSLTLGGSLTNGGNMYVGNYYMGSPSNVKVTGTLTNTDFLEVSAGNTAGANALLNVTGAVASTLTGNYQVDAYAGSAAIEWGSGGITSIGNGTTAGEVQLYGTLAYMEIGATNSNSALKGLTTIASDGELQMQEGAAVTTTGALTVNAGGDLYVDNGGGGGSSLTLGGSLTNNGLTQIGNYYMSSPSTVKVTGTLTNTDVVQVNAGNTTGANALLDVTGAAASTLTGTYQVNAYAGSSAIEWGSGGITTIGNGTTAGEVQLYGSLAYMEIGATNSNSALKGLTTITSDGELQMQEGTVVTTTGALTVNSGGELYVDNGGGGGSSLTLGGSLTNGGLTQVGNYYMTLPSTVKVTGTLTNTNIVQVNAGNTTGANALLNVTGAVASALTGTYQVNAYAGSSAIEWGSGGITSIGNGTTAGEVQLYGSLAYMEVGATNSNSALKGLTTIASDGELQIQDGTSVTTTGPLTVNAGGGLYVDNGANGGSSLTLGGSLTNSGFTQVGNYYMVSPSNVTVTGTLGNTGTVQVNAGNTTGANALLDVTGAAPSTLTGIYEVSAYAGSSAIEWGSGGITSIGNGTSSGEVVLSGALAYMETGATSSNSALKSLTTIASDGNLQLEDGASVTTTGALTVASGGELDVDSNGAGGSLLKTGGALTNNGSMQAGNYYMTSSSTANVGGSLTNSSTGVINVDAANTAGLNSVLEVTGPSLTNAGTINLAGEAGNAELEINGNVTISGAGKVILSNIATNIITGAVTTDTLTNASTIEGSGTIENIGIVNSGTILANQSTPILILPSSAGLHNTGTLSVLTGDTMQIGTSAGGALTNFTGTTLTGGTYSVGGTLEFGAPGASIVTDAANISLTGAGAQMINFGSTSLLTNLATITSAGSFTLGTSWGTFTTTGNFTNDGTLSVGGGDKFIVNSADSLTNFSGTTLTGGTYKITGVLEFAGANIVTNDANITLTGANSKIDSTTLANGLANFAINGTGASFTLGSGRSFTTAGNFTNNGALTVGAGDTFDVNGNLTNFSGTTLTGGGYTVNGTLQFNGADIVTNAASITLGSTTGKIVNQSGTNALLGLTTNTGKFTLSGNANLSTTGGSFTNSGTMTISSGSTLTVGGSSSNYTQTAGTTTVNGTLTGSGAPVMDLNGGNLYGTGTVDDGVVDAATITPGSATTTGKLQLNGTYAQNSGGTLDVTVGGLTAGTQFDQLNVSSTASLSGTLNVKLASGYTPAIGNTFDIVNASTISGDFTTITGLAINSSEHFTVTTVSGDEIVLTVVSGAAPSPSVDLNKLMHAGGHGGRYGMGVYSGARPWSGVMQSALSPVAAPHQAQTPHAPLLPARLGLSAVGHGFKAMDEVGTGVASLAPVSAGAAGGAGLMGISAVSASAYNSMASMNHMRFECGVDLGALKKTGRKRLVRALWASPDSPDAVNIGYVTMTTR